MAIACSVPVFRYALEHWQPDPYIAFVFYRGELTPEQQEIINSLKPEAVDGRPAANLFVKTVNVDTEVEGDEVLTQVWDAHKSDSLPHLVLDSPPKWGPPQTVWEGDLTAENAKRLMASPVRTKIKQNLLSGDSIVWVYLECGRKEEDDKAFAMLSGEIARLQGKLKLPEVVQEDLKELSVAPDSLKISFSAIRLSRNDAAEQPLIEMLRGVESDLHDKEYIDQPMAFPVFGRGRALYALVGDGIAPDLIEEACQFLTGACQCTVKRQNPGVDLLMNVDWDRYVEPTEAADASLPPLAGFSGFGAPAGENQDIQADGEAPAKPAPAEAEPVVAPRPEAAPATEAEAVQQTEAPAHEESAAVPPAEVAESPAESLLSKNVMLVLLVVAAAVVIGTFFLMPKAT